MTVPHLLLCGFFLLVSPALVAGHEVDQYVLPDGQEFEDLGDYWNEMFDTAVRKGMESLNREIDVAMRIPIPAVRDLVLAKCHSPGTVAWRVRKHLPVGLLAIAELELKLAMGDIPVRHEDRIQSFRASAFSTTYNHRPLLPDPRQLGRMTVMRSSVIKVHGTFMGTDKIGHFIGHGYQYFLTYRTSRKLGSCYGDAIGHAVNLGTNGPISEKMLVGFIPTGVFSNADQAANYLGLKFFMNLTEPVQLKGCAHPPILERHGEYWARREGIGAQYFAAFVSEHLDEVLNPCVYSWGMRDQMREQVEDRADQLLEWYVGNDPGKRHPAYFERTAQACQTYFGEDYGHDGDPDELLTLAEVCFDDEELDREESSQFQLAASRKPSSVFAIDVAALLLHEIGDLQVYEILVENRQSEDYENVQVVCQVPRGVHVTLLDEPARFDRKAYTLSWQVPFVRSGSLYSFRFVAKAVDEGTYSPKVVVRDRRHQYARMMYRTTVTPLGSESSVAGSERNPVESSSSADGSKLKIDILGPRTHRLGETKSYEVVVSNPQERDVENAIVRFEVAPQLRVKNVTGACAVNLEAKQVTWRLSTIAAGTEMVLRFSAKAVASGSFDTPLVVMQRSAPSAVALFRGRIVATKSAEQTAKRPNAMDARR